MQSTAFDFLRQAVDFMWSSACMIEKKLDNGKSLLRQFREELGLTRPQVRQYTGIAERTLVDLEKGKSIPNVENLVALSRLYNKSLKAMLEAMKIDVSGIPDDLPITN